MARNPNPGYKRNILPGLQVPSEVPPEVQKFLQALKEHIEQYIGSKGHPGERFVTLEDLKRAGIANYVVKRGRGELGNTAEQTAAARSTDSRGITELANLNDVKAAGVEIGDALVYIDGTWQSTKVFPSTVEFEDGVIIGDLEFSSAEELAELLPIGGGGSLVYANTSVPEGNTVANSNTETAFESTYTVPAEALDQGVVIRIKLAGTYSTDASSAPNLRIRVKLGDATIADTTAVTLATGESDAGWYIEVLAVVHAEGETGSLEAQGIHAFGGTWGHSVSTSAITIDTTEELTLSVTAQWSSADEDDTVTLREMLVYIDSVVEPGASGGGVTDHGELDGLTDDDHPQYVLREILTTDGDMFYRTGGDVARLAKGTDGQVLTMVAGAPAWATPSGGGGSSNPVPTITSISPDSLPAAGPETELTVTGTNFIYWSLILWDGVPLKTTYVSSTELKATISSSLLASTGTVDVKVASPLPGGGESSAAEFEIVESYAAMVLADTPKAYYRLGDAVGSSTVKDEVDSPTQDGSVFGTVTFELDGALTGDADTAAGADNSANNYIQFPVSLGFTTNNGMAIEAWLRIDDGFVILRDNTSTGGTGLPTPASSGSNIVVRVGGINVDTGIAMSEYMDGEFHHWVLEYVHDTTTVNLYLDGKLAHTEVISALGGSTNTFFRLFRNGASTSNSSGGRADEVAFYDHPLGLAAVQEHYALGTGS